MNDTRTDRSAKPLSEQFAQALRHLEERGDPEVMVEAFETRATLRRIPQGHSYQGPEGSREFWAGYLKTFASISTEFTRFVDGEDAAVLEWRSTGTLLDGEPFSYEGVSVVERGEHQPFGDFRTYYDTSGLSS